MADDKFILMGLDDENSKHVAEVLKNKTCKKILDFLGDRKEASEKDISDGLDIPINTVEYNLKKLVKAGLVGKSKNFFWSVKGKKIPMYKLARKHIIISPNKTPSISYLKSILPTILVIAGLIALIGLLMLQPEVGLDKSQLKQFSSQFELDQFIKSNAERVDKPSWTGGIATITSAETSIGTASQKAADDYSATNIQVEGVDEADIVKNDGKYIYTVSGNKIVIVNAYPAEDMETLSKIVFDEGVYEIFINEEKLIVFANAHNADYSNTVYIYDIEDRNNPKLEDEISFDGNYVDSRMIGKYVYVVSTKHADIDNPNPPIYESNGIRKKIQPTDIYYFDYPDVNYVFTSIVAINVENGNFNSEEYLTGSSRVIYVSQDNIYLTYQKRENYKEIEKTVIHKVNIDEEDIEYIGVGEVPGYLLNQFSMDEHNDYFRIATTTGNVWGGDSLNHLYVLDENLVVVGSVENLAKGEKIYSARFLGNRAYLVTFKKVDPLFVIDLETPQYPKVLGYLKITGYSDYLHIYDENHIIGLGKETRGGNEQFSYYQGIKISLFDVSDVANPVEKAKIEIGDRGTDSYALHDHRAFLFDKERNLLVIPVHLAEIDESRYLERGQEIPANAYGNYVWQGAYALNINLDEINVRGRISHDGNDIKRSLYMDEVLYTVSDSMIKANDLETIDEINSLNLNEPYTIVLD